jgi:hypothetical protein
MGNTPLLGMGARRRRNELLLGQIGDYATALWSACPTRGEEELSRAPLK